MGRVKEETIKGLFVRMFNRLYSERSRLLGDYKAKLEREKLSKLDNERIAKLDEEIENLLEVQGGHIIEFDDDLYSKLFEKIVVKERTKLIFHLKNGLAFEEPTP